MEAPDEETRLLIFDRLTAAIREACNQLELELAIDEWKNGRRTDLR